VRYYTRKYGKDSLEVKSARLNLEKAKGQEKGGK